MTQSYNRLHFGTRVGDSESVAKAMALPSTMGLVHADKQELLGGIRLGSAPGIHFYHCNARYAGSSRDLLASMRPGLRC